MLKYVFICKNMNFRGLIIIISLIITFAQSRISAEELPLPNALSDGLFFLLKKREKLKKKMTFTR